MPSFKELQLPTSPSLAEVNGNIESANDTAEGIPLKPSLSLIDLLSHCRESERLAAPRLSSPATLPNRKHSKGSRLSILARKAFFYYAYTVDRELSDSLLRNACSAIEDRYVGKDTSQVGNPERADAGEDSPLNGNPLPTIQHIAFHPTLPILAFSTSLSTIHLYDIEKNIPAYRFLSTAAIPDSVEQGQYPRITAITFSKDDRLAVGLDTGTLDLWTINFFRPRNTRASAPARGHLFNPSRVNYGECSKPTVSTKPAREDFTSPRSVSSPPSLFPSQHENASLNQSFNDGAQQDDISKLASCQTISLIQESKYLSEYFTPQEIVGAITCLSFSPSGRHLAIGTTKSGLWVYNIIWRSSFNVFPGQVAVTSISWGPPLSTLPLGGLYRPAPDLTYLVAGLQDGEWVYFRTQEIGIGVNFTGGRMASSVVTDVPLGEVNIRKQSTAAVNSILIAPPFIGDEKPKKQSDDSFWTKNHPIIFLARENMQGIEILSPTFSTSPKEAYESVKIGYVTLQTLPRIIFTIIAVFPILFLKFLINQLSNLLKIDIAAGESSGYGTRKLGTLDTSYIGLVGTTGKTQSNSDRLARAGSDTIFRGANGNMVASGYGGEVLSMTMDREGQRLLVRFHYQGKTSLVAFDSRGLYPNALMTASAGELSTEMVEKKLLLPIGVLSPRSAQVHAAPAQSEEQRRNLLTSLRLFGGVRVKKMVAGTLIAPYVDEILRRMQTVENKEALQKGKGRQGSEARMQIGEVGVSQWKFGGIVGAVVAEGTVSLGNMREGKGEGVAVEGDGISFVWSVWR